MTTPIERALSLSTNACTALKNAQRAETNPASRCEQAGMARAFAEVFYGIVQDEVKEIVFFASKEKEGRP